MNIDETTLAEQRLDRLASIARYHQGAWLFICILLLIFRPHHYRGIGECLAVIALLASIISARIYIQAGKKVEEFKTFSQEEREKKKNEYFRLFLWPHFLWTGTIIFFSYL